MDNGFRTRTTPAGKTRAKLALLLIFVLLISTVLTFVFSKPGSETDMTGEKLYTVSEQTSSVIDRLDTVINIYTLYSPGNDSSTLSGLIKTYSAKSPYISVMNIDSSSLPNELKGFDILSELPYGSAIVYCGSTGLFRAVTPSEMYFEEDGKAYSLAESKLTAAIEYVHTGREYRLKMLYQHREKTAEELSEILTELNRKNVGCENYDLLAGEAYGKNELLLSVSPRQDFSAEEIARLKEFISGGGTFFVLIDMAEFDPSSGRVLSVNPEIPNLLSFIDSLGIEVTHNMIADSNPENTGMRPTVIKTTAADDPLLGAAAKKEAVIGECSALKINSDSKAKGLIYTSETAYGHYMSAPYCVAASCEYGEGTVIAVSSSNLLTMNSSLSNSQIIKAVITSCGIVPPDAIDAKPLNPDNMTVDHGVIKIFLSVAVMIALPAAVIILGAKILKKRRHP